MLKIFTVLLFLLTIFTPVLAQEDTTIDEVSANREVLAEEIDELDTKEEERINAKVDLLGITLPEYTDNPSYVITFKDPSKDTLGVEIELDGKDWTEIKSPYTLPALSIGEHSMRFRFTDENGQVQILEHELIVIPRPPIINSPEIGKDSIIIGGTALSNSEIIYTITMNSFNESEIVTSDGSGNWSISFSPESGLSDGIYTFTVYTRKYGYASNLPEPLVFAVGEGIGNTLNSNSSPKEIYFSFKEINKENINDIFKDNRDLILLTVGAFLSGGVIFVFLKSLFMGKRREKELKKAEDLIHKQNNTNNREKTLKELFGGEEVTEEKTKEDGKTKEKVDKEEGKEKIRIVNKDIFLKNFKTIDPDEKDGKEKKVKDVKKKIKVSLTSSQEDSK